MIESQTIVVEADLSRAEHQDATARLLNAYAMDPMGDGKPLSDSARRDLIPGLRAHPTTIVFLAYSETEAVGLAICFRGFSTFAARPLINIHDLFVMPAYRGTGLGRRMLSAVEQRAEKWAVANSRSKSKKTTIAPKPCMPPRASRRPSMCPGPAGPVPSKPLEFRARILL